MKAIKQYPRTLHSMTGYGIIDLVKYTAREVVPMVKANRFNIELCT